MCSLRFRAADGRFGAILGPIGIRRVLALCGRAGDHETGGILVGRYSEDGAWAIVERVAEPPPGSRAGQTWFYRGTAGVLPALEDLWVRRRRYYLGEWHFHPCGPSLPSSTDRTSMARIGASDSYRCPEPLLLVVGADPAGRWEMSMQVFPRGQLGIEMPIEPRAGQLQATSASSS